MYCTFTKGLDAAAAVADADGRRLSTLCARRIAAILKSTATSPAPARVAAPLCGPTPTSTPEAARA